MTPSTTISLLWLFTVAIRAIPFPSWHLQECDTHDVRIIDICGADERARQPTGGKGPRITSGGPYSPRRSDQTCVHPVLSALMRKTRFLDSVSLQKEERERVGNSFVVLSTSKEYMKISFFFN
ncbi:hypothetical protein ALC60_06185 [Trachymyrmex zeteki]|uniref:Secreted protein n=1 Tax=Mycetomoellerius zeteki TaxID=64791 RepID=A0A151X3J7_9HYME|nr:hypothetical protein ALC60_06185 [Trachymyrmex zeteki]